MTINFKDWCEKNDPKLLEEWSSKNAPLKPSDFTKTSSQLVIWSCEKGHEWQYPVRDRTKNDKKCPICHPK